MSLKEIGPALSEELKQVLKEAIDGREKSAENLSKKAGLAPGTVRNILGSGNAAPESLIALAPILNRTAEEMFVLMGWLPPRPSTWSFEAEEAARLIDRLPVELRSIPLESVRAIAQSLQRPGFQQLARPHLEVADRRGDQ